MIPRIAASALKSGRSVAEIKQATFADDIGSTQGIPQSYEWNKRCPEGIGAISQQLSGMPRRAHAAGFEVAG